MIISIYVEKAIEKFNLLHDLDKTTKNKNRTTKNKKQSKIGIEGTSSA